jgi:hypothetical protein
MQRELNVAKTAAEGREIIEDVEVIYIRTPGSRDEITNLVSDDHRARFRTLYDAWKTRREAPVTGTPLEQWPRATTSMIDDMRTFGIRTVEELANISDAAVMANMGWRDLRTQAQAWLASAKDSAEAARLAMANQHLQDQISAMQAQIDALMEVSTRPVMKLNQSKAEKPIEPSAAPEAA